MTFRQREFLLLVRLLSALWLVTACALSGQAVGGQDKPKTSPVPPKPLHFIVYGDTRDGHAIHRKLVAMIVARKPDFVLQTGDLVHSGSAPDLWKIYDDITGAMRRKIPVYPTRGNHDVGGPGYEAHFTVPFSSGNKLYYSFDKAGCHFTSLAVDEYTPFGPDSPQYHWLETDLAAAQKRSRHIFVYFHVPPYSIGSHGSDLTVRQALCPLFRKYGVRIVFNGHDHIYYRTRRDGITYVVTGGGGAPLYFADPNKGAIAGDKWESVNHLVDCVVKGKEVTLTALRADGTTLDHFTVTAP